MIAQTPGQAARLLSWAAFRNSSPQAHTAAADAYDHAAQLDTDRRTAEYHRAAARMHRAKSTAHAHALETVRNPR